MVNSLTPELNPSAQSCLPRFLLGILIFKGHTARRLYKSFGVKGLNEKERDLRIQLQVKDNSATLVVENGFHEVTEYDLLTYLLHGAESFLRS
jgi:hypothetical protein